MIFKLGVKERDQKEKREIRPINYLFEVPYSIGI